MKENLQQSFASPSSAYRSKPFWAWNGKLEDGELRRQIRLMHAMGMGGFFMHARVGLATPYLSDTWMKLTGACIDEARQLGMEAWLYDEDRWPSGAAGGLVTRDPRYRMRKLVMTELREAGTARWTPQTLAMFRARIDGSRATGVRRIARGARPGARAAGESLLVFTVETDKCSDWFNGYTYLDTLNPAAVKAFINTTHAAYAKRLGPLLDKTVPGIFADEPHHGPAMADDGPSRQRAPWTDRLPAVFKARYGQALLPHLVELFFDVDGRDVTPARWQYHDCITHLFVTAFGQQIFDWCEANHLEFTGHVLEEDTLSRQTKMVGSAMRFYEYMQAPGMDLLTEHWRIYDTAKQVASAARQFGRSQRLTETYGCTGWDFSFAGHKALADWQIALGINLRCPHLAWYTMEGQAKRDYPASISYQSPWWQQYGMVEDYLARINVVMQRGAEVRDVLVIHPVESMWLLVKRGWQKLPATDAMDKQLVALRDALLTQGVDFDYGDEEHLSRMARVRRTKTGAELAVGRAAYRIVVVPPLVTMRASTLSCLRRFAAAGGRVVFAGEPAAYVDAQATGAVAELARTCVRAPAAGAGLAAALGPAARRVAITDGAGQALPAALYQLREDADAWYLFVCNTGHSPAQLQRDWQRDVLVRDRVTAFGDVRIRGFADAAGQPEEWDPQSGGRTAAAARRERSGAWEIRTDLPALGSRLFVIPKRRSAARLPAQQKWRTTASRRLQAKRWDVILSEENVCVLDRPRYRVGAAPWHGETEILRVDQIVRTALGVRPRSGQMVQPWARPPAATPAPGVPLKLEYALSVEQVPSGGLFLALEHPERFTIEVNGHPLGADTDAGWWTDLSLRKLPLDPALLRQGRNHVRLTCRYEASHGLEIAYLLGNFGVRVRETQATLVAPVTSLRLGDWVAQGLPFYAGHVTYTTRVAALRARAQQRLVVRIPGYRGVAVAVLVDGRQAGVAAWAPEEVDITDLVSRGQAFTLGIQVIGHRRNSHGPLHLSEKWPTWTGPGEFATTGDRWQEAYQVVPCGLLAPPVIDVRS